MPRFKPAAHRSENQNVTDDEDKRVATRESADAAATWLRRARRPPGGGATQRFDVKHFVFGLVYGFALGFILEAILASHP